ncbi:uncharacterized protein ARB_02418 [Trichophyton benhamiae CBS 112371]|uniref:Uncharacterized protein n=1 Tax=Arthroderma benhamiae (strain ATCC MYA-4681 / CBS 112371) TaxID=663331 RepID=D4B1T7_ARTBC|nr:uncharacterized protein ARB_02418 [Trichophyton benhamiae CBS 112371]EFE30719.1 hypothetical protein ARB_02418 [Trichophyton benhamiae CBS 112371]
MNKEADEQEKKKRSRRSSGPPEIKPETLALPPTKPKKQRSNGERREEAKRAKTPQSSRFFHNIKPETSDRILFTEKSKCKKKKKKKTYSTGEERRERNDCEIIHVDLHAAAPTCMSTTSRSQRQRDSKTARQPTQQRDRERQKR